MKFKSFVTQMYNYTILKITIAYFIFGNGTNWVFHTKK